MHREVKSPQSHTVSETDKLGTRQLGFSIHTASIVSLKIFSSGKYIHKI